MTGQDYLPPDFDGPELRNAPEARFEPAPADGVLPEGFFSSTNLPTYVRIEGRWVMPRTPRMDSALVLEHDGGLRALEFRYVRKGQPVAMGEAEDGSMGILVDAMGLLAGAAGGSKGEFQFMASEVSREKPVDYARLAELLVQERERGGHVVWVLGPAVVHSRGRDVITWFVENGFVNAIMAGNALAVHDIESAIMGTTLGMDAKGRPRPGGHAYHMRAINRIAAAGSIEAAVDQGLLTNGIIHAAVTHHVPCVLAASIRDDGPLPGVFTSAIEAQEHMREHAIRTTMVIMVATALHSIAFGNMLPAYHQDDDGCIHPITTIAVDSSEFVVNKLKDRGTHQAFGIITNAQDFLQVLRTYVERAVASAGTQ